MLARNVQHHGNTRANFSYGGKEKALDEALIQQRKKDQKKDEKKTCRLSRAIFEIYAEGLYQFFLLSLSLSLCSLPEALAREKAPVDFTPAFWRNAYKENDPEHKSIKKCSVKMLNLVLNIFCAMV